MIYVTNDLKFQDAYGVSPTRAFYELLLAALAGLSAHPEFAKESAEDVAAYADAHASAGFNKLIERINEDS